MRDHDVKKYTGDHHGSCELVITKHMILRRLPLMQLVNASLIVKQANKTVL